MVPTQLVHIYDDYRCLKLDKRFRMCYNELNPVNNGSNRLTDSAFDCLIGYIRINRLKDTTHSLAFVRGRRN